MVLSAVCQFDIDTEMESTNMIMILVQVHPFGSGTYMKIIRVTLYVYDGTYNEIHIVSIGYFSVYDFFMDGYL